MPREGQTDSNCTLPITTLTNQAKQAVFRKNLLVVVGGDVDDGVGIGSIQFSIVVITNAK